ncbi:Alcohol dehydrogenase zinc-binding domain protein [Kribbella flavida DSM 17836]|uniref:Alcohol dehydrogenase zinc-binding domain protein n=1 Tax=Kribbella flavida (strain DSM 17836 / JCM 10339 / NBRC 14399) TaxID=479435 RepID=D2PKQ8_KRIFD|nr:zinc-binding dehydrogenase [Kribbella flavida]ADB32375.1 Alcohol dehydrogenase zinc-binding domain protein [Kribbella flavida DSM 17836]
MRAIRLHEFGPADNLTYEDVPDPVPGAGEVLIAVEAAGVHLMDTALRQGSAGGGPVAPPVLPTIPGREVAGTVEAVGSDTDNHWIGKRVVVHLGPVPGGYAERAVARAESLHEIPDHLGGAHAVATIGTGRTAIGVLEQAALTADDVVLITAAAGGIGSLFVQYARNAGATVVGLAGGPEKTQQVVELGAQVAVDYRRADWPGRVREQLGERDLTVVLDGVGGENGRRAFELLGIGGRILMFGWSGGGPVELTTDDLMQRGLSATWAIGPKLMRRLRTLETKALEQSTEAHWVPLVTTFPLAKAADAHRALENRETVGKVVLLP